MLKVSCKYINVIKQLYSVLLKNFFISVFCNCMYKDSFVYMIL